ncbi:MAG: Peroxisome biosynthesis protein pex1, partial [Watsoniomyces obsoletus]
MPDMDDRLDIIEAVSSKLTLKPDVSSRLLTIAKKTEGFTGADLQALMYNAHLEAIHDLLGDRSTSQTKANMTNGTHQQRKGSASSRSKVGSKKHDFSQFIYGAEQDAEARKSRSTIDSKAAIVAKLDELKMLRKRERAAMRGDYAALHQSAGQSKANEQSQDNE